MLIYPNIHFVQIILSNNKLNCSYFRFDIRNYCLSTHAVFVLHLNLYFMELSRPVQRWLFEPNQINYLGSNLNVEILVVHAEMYVVHAKIWVGSTQLCGHTNFVLGWSWAVTILNFFELLTIALKKTFLKYYYTRA